MDNATISEQQYTETKFNNKPIKLFKIEKSIHNHILLTIWFWRMKAHYGYYHSRCLEFKWMKKIWTKNNVKPEFGYRDNKGKKANGDKCLDATFSLGYFLINFVNYNLQETEYENK